MDIVQERAAGMDISKRDAKVCAVARATARDLYRHGDHLGVRPRGRFFSCGTSWNASTSRQS
jgi:hypothetical protein